MQSPCTKCTKMCIHYTYNAYTHRVMCMCKEAVHRVVWLLIGESQKNTFLFNFGHLYTCSEWLHSGPSTQMAAELT